MFDAGILSTAILVRKRHSRLIATKKNRQISEAPVKQLLDWLLGKPANAQVSKCARAPPHNRKRIKHGKNGFLIVVQFDRLYVQFIL